ncbi:TPA: hypothetical protein N0F65_006402 [Lagenidium giganteum]|uniref:Phosphatidylinositol 3-kinase n=1 Tax=Lagenidium giganteum TaxID=4803 RepID=A0AAV2YQS5_9STRA|nr:TPA: hypothetical protein N0F65_006402 [Lagenidium giganteum]
MDHLGRHEREYATAGAAVDLSFSQILEARSWQTQRRRPPPPPSRASSARNGQRHGAAGAGPGRGFASTHSLGSVYESLEERDDDAFADTPSSRGTKLSDTASEDEWATGDDGHVGGQDMYRFVQPRRLSSWVQDDAVNACFKCHTLFTLMVRKHHCRACGRIFCNACSSQRVVIPGDYESMPVAHASSYTAITSNASDMIGNLSWYVLSYASPSSSSEQSNHAANHATYMEHTQRLTPEAQQERFLKDVERLQRDKVISKFTPCRNRAGSNPMAGAPSTSSFVSSHVPAGSVLQRVCDDCACALQQRRHHYNTVKVFELCQFNLKELRTLGQVCRKWHRASIMCLSTFRQIQYYLPTHRLSDREKMLLVINRGFLCGHTKWILQLVKAIDFRAESEDEDTNPANAALVREVLKLIEQPRQHKCMLTMCSRLCQSEMGSVDALEMLSDENVRNGKLRRLCVEALLKSATDNEWLSFLPVLLHSLSVEHNAVNSHLGQALIRQAKCDVRFCYDLYWGLTVMAEDTSCRRTFDALRQRLLLTLSQFKEHTTCSTIQSDIVDQLLRGQEFVDVMWKLPPRVAVQEIRNRLQNAVEKSALFGSLTTSSATADSEGDSAPQRSPFLRVPVDPLVKVSGINFKTVEVKRSAEAPIIITCTGVERDEDSEENRLSTLRLEKAGGSEQPSPVRGTGSSRHITANLRPAPSHYRIMYKRDDLRKDAIVQNIINVMYTILKHETRLDIPLVTYRVLPTSSFDGFIEIVENAHTLYSIIRDHGNILNFLHHYNGHRTLSEISTSFRESLAAYTVITFLLGVGDRHADNVMLTKDGILFHIDYGFILGKDPKPLQPPMRLDHYMIEALGGTQTAQFEQFKKLCVIAFNCLRRHVSLFMIMLTLVVKAMPEITDFDTNYTQSDLEAFVIERFLPGQTDDEAATALMLRMEGKLNEKIGLKLSDFVHAHANEKTVSKGMLSVGSSVKIGVETVEATVSTVASSLSSGASSIYNYMWGSTPTR